MSDWNPKLYLKFKWERTQPAIDLIGHIDKNDPERIIDIGCGPGNSTKVLMDRWSNAYIIGMDNSPNMIDLAISEHPQIEWIVQDAKEDLRHLGQFDIVFSNAALQWLPKHESLFVRLFCMLKEDGVLAIQVPNITHLPLHIALEEVAKYDKWSDYMDKRSNHLYMYEPKFYYETLCNLTHEIDVWETNYYHIMNDYEDLIEWYKSTGIKPYLDVLPSEHDKAEFQKDVLDRIKEVYCQQKDGKVLFPFKRTFVVAHKKV